MYRINYVQHRSWKEFKSSIVPELFPDDMFREEVYFFRGQGSSDWRLTTTFDRWLSFLGKRHAVEDADKLLTYFKDECEKLDITETRLSNNDYLKSLGQHFGLPTRLLDWTRSPYVAAFFAFNEAFLKNVEHIKQGNVAVWALKVGSEVFGAEKGVEIKRIAPSENHRLINQEGVFTLSRTPFSCLEEYVDAFGEGETALFQFSIPSSEAEVAMADLASMGLTHTRLFPDVGGCASAAKIRMILAQQF